MVTINGTTYYKPREIASQRLIVNSKGNSDYGYILRLIKAGHLKSQVFNEDSKIHYNLVPASEIERFTKRFANK